jgi:hypothetical protein
MKGPMTTQSMRGLTNHGPMHWRGDRTGTDRAGDETLWEAAFKEFNAAFDALAGLGGELPDPDMQTFTDFAMRINYPPNPIRQLEVCAQCHPIDPASGTFGTRGLSADNSQPGEKNFKIPHFRDQYQKVGMFGWGFQSTAATGPQVRGFSINHNGATSSNFIIADLGMPQDDLLVQRGRVESPVPECDLVVSGIVGGVARSWSMDRNGAFFPDRAGAAAIDLAAVETVITVAGDYLTFMCTPWGSGRRIGIDRDLDGVLDGDE